MFWVIALLSTACAEDEALTDGSDNDNPVNISVVAFGDALSDQVNNGDGNGIDNYFRNSGVVINEASNTYFAVNGVHPVNSGDYSSYYTKSIVEASLETDEIVNVWAFDASTLGREVDMEGLTFAEGTDKLYIGDEYNYIYELDLTSGQVTREWNLADMGLNTATDRGIEALTYLNGYFYAGIQEETRVYQLDLHLDATSPNENAYQQVDAIASFDTSSPPSGLFGAADGTLYMVAFGGGSASQTIYNFSTDGTLNCSIALSSEIGLVRPDGIFIDSNEQYVYIADSQGALNGRSGMYRLDWSALSCD